MAGLKGLICPDTKENVPFSHCFLNCGKRCHPLPLLIAMNSDRNAVKDTYHVTEILNPPQQVYLQRNNDYYATFDSQIWMTLGTAWHKIPENSAETIRTLGLSDLHEIEESFTVEIGDYTLTGKMDYYDAETETLWDYKTMKVYPVKKLKAGNWDDSTYKDQLNIYRVFGKPEAKHLKIEAIIKDWSTRVQKYDNISPVETIEVPIMPEVAVRQKVADLIHEHSENQKDPSKIRPCKVPDETWYNDNPRSPNRGVHLRCRDYCPVNKLCPQYKEILNANTG